MKPIKLRIMNIGPYEDEVIRLESIPGHLIAICGLNGEGKTMMMESIFAGMYRNFPSRDAGLYRYCTDRHAGIEFEFEVGGRIYNTYLNLDSKARKMEAVIASDGSPLNDGLTGSFDEQIQKILGYEAQALASAYGAQNKKGNFVELEKAKRKDLFITMIGAAYLDSISTTAKAMAASLEPEKNNLIGQLETLRQLSDKPIPDTAGIELSIKQDTEKLEDLQIQIDDLNKFIAINSTKLDKLPSLQSEKSVHVTAGMELVSKAAAIKLAIEAARSLIESMPAIQESLKMATDNAASIRERIITTREKVSRLSELKKAVDDIRLKIASFEDARGTIVNSMRQQALLSEGLDTMRMKAQELAGMRKESSEAADLLSKLNSEMIMMSQNETSHAHLMTDLTAKLLKSKAAENNAWLLYEAARKGERFLGEVPCHGQGEYAECKFLKDAISAAANIDELSAAVDNAKIASLAIQQEMDVLPKGDPQVKAKISSEIKRLERVLLDHKAKIAQYEKDTAMIAEAESASGKLAMLKESIMTTDAVIETARKEYATASEAYAAAASHQKSLATYEEEIIHIDKAVGELTTKLRDAEAAQQKLGALQADIGRINDDIANNLKRIEDIDAEIGTLQGIKITHEASLKQFNELVDLQKPILVKRLKEANYQLVKAQEEAGSILAAKDKAKEVESKLNETNYKIACRSKVSSAFGPMEIQSFEIDSAGPEVSRIANELLFNCFGPRFSIRFVTQEAKADGKGFKDEFDVAVYDQRHDRWVSIDDLSGGEKVIVTEALALAIALYNREKNGITWNTLFRDEVSGSLDDKHAPQYIKMLRAAREMGHFERVYFISHQGRMKEMADSRIVVSGGKLSVES